MRTEAEHEWSYQCDGDSKPRSSTSRRLELLLRTDRAGTTRLDCSTVRYKTRERIQASAAPDLLQVISPPELCACGDVCPRVCLLTCLTRRKLGPCDGTGWISDAARLANAKRYSTPGSNLYPYINMFGSAVPQRLIYWRSDPRGRTHHFRMPASQQTRNSHVLGTEPNHFTRRSASAATNPPKQSEIGKKKRTKTLNLCLKRACCVQSQERSGGAENGVQMETAEVSSNVIHQVDQQTLKYE